METTIEKSIQLETLLDTNDRREYISFCTLDKNPRQKYLIAAIAVIGLAAFLLKDKGLPPWINLAAFVVVIALLFQVGRQRNKTETAQQESWMVLKCLLRVTLDEAGVSERGAERMNEDIAEGFEEDFEEDFAGVSERSSRWEELSSAYENGRYFYLFRNSTEAFILQKSRMTEELAFQVRGLLAAKLDERFHPAK